ncbi:MAG: hypothetical protein AAGD18_05485 [Actinomycetota bacterium]
MRDLVEFTFFVDTHRYDVTGGELPASWEDLVDAGVEHVDIPVGYAHDLGERIPVRVTGSAGGLRWFAALISVDDELQLEELDRALADR